MNERKQVLFLCTGNSCRSQMAEGWLRHLGKGTVTVASAGTNPAGISERVISCMQETGVDISGQDSKPVGPFAGETFDYVITLCENARQSCPVFPGAASMLHWDLPDPSGAQGSEEERIALFRLIRDRIRLRCEDFLGKVLDQFLAKGSHSRSQVDSSS